MKRMVVMLALVAMVLSVAGVVAAENGGQDPFRPGGTRIAGGRVAE